MRDLSLRGIARRYRGRTGDLSVRSDVLETSGAASLREHLEDLAREEHEFDVSECIYDWTAAFEQTWTHIRIRIELDPDANANMAGLQNTWANGITTTWGNRWGCSRPGELTCPLTFEVDWVNNNEHHQVRVRQGPAQSNMTTWDDQDTGDVAAHEYGHMLGHEDEYSDSNCPDRDPVNTSTVMDDNNPPMPARLFQPFANRIGSNLAAI